MPRLSSKLNAQIYSEAAEWFVTCRSDALNDAERRKFDAWLRQSPQHLSAYLELAAIWDEGPGLDAKRRYDTESLIAEALRDFFERQAVPTMQQERGTEFRRQPVELGLQLFQALLGIEVEHGIHVWHRSRGVQHFAQLDGGRRRRLPKPVLLNDMLRDREQISLRRADGLDIRNAQHAEVNLLQDVRHVGGITQPQQQKTAQFDAVAGNQAGNQRASSFGRHVPPNVGPWWVALCRLRAGSADSVTSPE